jgi:hypothetical protein
MLLRTAGKIPTHLFSIFATVGILGCDAPKPATEEGRTLAQSTDHTKQLAPLFVDDSLELQYDFPVKNDADQTIRFTELVQGCACMGASTIDAMALAPGEETVLHFHVDLRNRTGPQRIVCRLVEAGGSNWFYAIETTLYKRAAFAENGTLHFGMVDPRAEEVRETAFLLHAENAESLPSQVALHSKSAHVRVETGEGSIETLPDHTVVRKVPLKLRLRAPDTTGLGQTIIVAEFSRAGAKKEVETGISWNVSSFYSVEPPQVFFGTVDPSSAKVVEKSVLIRRKDGEALRIKAAKTSSGSVRCSVEPTENPAVWRVMLVLDPKSMSEPVWSELVVETDYRVQPRVKIPLAALVTQSK